jgi:hypothetical protein
MNVPFGVKLNNCKEGISFLNPEKFRKVPKIFNSFLFEIEDRIKWKKNMQ